MIQKKITNLTYETVPLINSDTSLILPSLEERFQKKNNEIEELKNSLFVQTQKLDFALTNQLNTYTHLKNHGMGNINDCLMFVLNDSKQIFWNWYSIAVEVLKENKDSPKRELLRKKLLTEYFRGMGNKGQECKSNGNLYNRCVRLLLYSLYFMPIIIGIRFFPGKKYSIIEYSLFTTFSLQ
jgi:hypothetical protein